MVTTTRAHLKTSLSRILAGVRDDKEVLVTDRGTPVARIVPYRPGGAELDDRLRGGQLGRAGGTVPPSFWTQDRPADALQLAAALTWARQAPQGHDLVSLDLCLREAALLEGFRVLPQS